MLFEPVAERSKKSDMTMLTSKWTDVENLIHIQFNDCVNATGNE